MCERVVSVKEMCVTKLNVKGLCVKELREKSCGATWPSPVP